MSSFDTPTKTKVKPSPYNALSFHGVRCISAICSIIVGCILAFFAVALKNDGYKVPWTFLIVSLLSLVVVTRSDNVTGRSSGNIDTTRFDLHIMHTSLHAPLANIQSYSQRTSPYRMVGSHWSARLQYLWNIGA